MTEETLIANEQALLELASGRLNNPSLRNAALGCSKGPAFLEDRPDYRVCGLSAPIRHAKCAIAFLDSPCNADR